ncbi:MAG: hypothetical protein J3K34DRAFT_522608 [Monoraphidium minutum]|nr:MAG: hypothetical protein J3K34DRAFT_522608 [Monoraphidium minutum]
MPDPLVACWVASTPSACVWRHPCLVLVARLLLSQLLYLAHALRTRLPRALAAAPVRALCHLAGARAARRRGGGGAGGSGGGGGGAAGGGGVELPLVILQGLGPWLPPRDMAAGRLACRAWRDCLGAQVASAALPPALWQRRVRGQLAQLRGLTAAFPLLRTVRAGFDAGAPADARAARRTMGLLARTMPALRGLALRGVADAASWPAIAEGLAPLAPQLSAFEVWDSAWPDPASLSSLAGALTRLTRLTLHSAVFSRLGPVHVEAIAGMGWLQELSLGFRTVEGTAAVPLALDPLVRLTRLSALDLEYTGLLELSSCVGFRRAQDLSRLTGLTSLSVRLVPLRCADGLAALPALRALHLAQLAPLPAAAAAALARCSALARLDVEPLPWEHLPALGHLTGLCALGVHLHRPPRGGLPPAAAGALLALAPLARLRAFGVAGQLELPPAVLAALAAAWPALRSLDLCCGLGGGTAGFTSFSALRRLRLGPYRWDAWSAEPPPLLHPAELPEGLTSLEARDVWVCAPGPDAARLSAARASEFSWGGVCLAAGGGGGAPAGGGGGCTCGGVACVAGCLCGGGGGGGRGSRGFGFAAGAGRADAGAPPAGAPPAAVAPAAAAAPPPPLTPAARAAALTLSTPRLRRLALRCAGGGRGEELPLPGLSRLTALEELDVDHPQITGRDLDALTSFPSARALRALRLRVGGDGARGRGGGALTKLTRLAALEDLQIHAPERALGSSALAAVASMGSLRRLTLVTSPDAPPRFAGGLQALTRLRRLEELRVGLGFGTLGSLRRLRFCVGRALPRCAFDALADADAAWDEAGAAAGCGGGGSGAGLGGGGAAGCGGGGAKSGAAAGAPGLGLGLGGAKGGGGGGDGDDGVGEAAATAVAEGGGVRGPPRVRLVRTSWPG